MSDAQPERRRPVVRYVVAPRDDFFWLARISIDGTVWVSPYTDLDVARASAAYLNSHVQWEGG